MIRLLMPLAIDYKGYEINVTVEFDYDRGKTPAGGDYPAEANLIEVYDGEERPILRKLLKVDKSYEKIILEHCYDWAPMNCDMIGE